MRVAPPPSLYVRVAPLPLYVRVAPPPSVCGGCSAPSICEGYVRVVPHPPNCEVATPDPLHEGDHTYTSHLPLCLLPTDATLKIIRNNHPSLAKRTPLDNLNNFACICFFFALKLFLSKVCVTDHLCMFLAWW